MIVDYPESEPALKDLSLCLKRVALKGSLISSLEKRLVIVFAAYTHCVSNFFSTLVVYREHIRYAVIVGGFEL